MRKLRALAFSFLVALSQLLPVSFAWAQAQAPAPAPAPAPPPPPADYFPVGRESGQGVDLGIPNSDGPYGFASGPYPPGSPRASLFAQPRTPLILDAPKEWQGKDVRLSVLLREDGSIEDVKVDSSSGIDALDLAAVAHAKQLWHGAPLPAGVTDHSVKAQIRFPEVKCRKRGNVGWTPGLPLALAQDNPVRPSFDVTIAPDGRIAGVVLHHSSGDAAFDAAILTHIRQTWRFGAFPENCAGFTVTYGIAIPSKRCSPQPLLETRTLPEVGPQDRSRALLLQIGVTSEGKVQFTDVVDSSGDASLDAATVARVKQAWRWLPASCNGVRPENNNGRLTVAMDLVRIEFSRAPS